MAWYAMQLDGYHAHPLNRGWMNAFRRWTNAPTFHRYWPFLRAEYSEEFVGFCERALNLLQGEVTRHRLGKDPKLDGTLEKLIGIVNKEFIQEWGKGRDIEKRVASARSVVQGTKVRPLVWLLFLESGDAKPRLFPCGIVCAAAPAEKQDGVLELFVWLRGPYRNLGIGRRCFPALLEKLQDRDQGLPALGVKRLITFYPEDGVTIGERLQKAMWMNFFFDYGFRRVGRAGRAGTGIELARSFDV
jgi:GNAT superfamily N-acetyltransferase